MSKPQAVIYARQSSGCEDESESIEMQIKKCQELAEKLRLEVIGVYSDANCSGRLYPSGAEAVAELDEAFQDWHSQHTLEKKSRPGLQTAMSLLPQIDCLITYEITRLYRPVSQSFLQHYIDNQLIKHNVRIETVKDGSVNLSNFSDSLVTTIKSHVNDNQIQLNTEKSKMAMAKLKDDGIYPTMPRMYGIRYIGGKEKTVEVIGEQAEVIKFVFEQIIRLKPYNWIVREMNKLFPGRTSGKGFYPSSLRNIAGQPFYCGYMFDTRGALVKAKQMRGKEIISFETWNKVQKIMEKNRMDPQRRKKLSHPFSRLLYCGYCGARMVVGLDNGKTYYHCFHGANTLGNPDCRKARVTINLIRKPKMYTGLKDAVAPLLILSQYKELELNGEMIKKSGKLEGLKIELANFERRLEEAVSAYSEGGLGLELLQSVQRTLNGKIARLKAEIGKIENACANARQTEERAQEYLRKIDDLMKGEVEEHVYEDLLRNSVKKIRCFHDHLDFETVYGNFTLDRYMDGVFRNFPKFTYSVERAKDNPSGLRKSKVHVTYIYNDNKNESLIVDLEVMKIYEKK